MSTETTQGTTPPSPQAEVTRRRLGAAGRFVEYRIRSLLGRQTDREEPGAVTQTSASRAALARLRRGVGRELGELPELFPLVLSEQLLQGRGVRDDVPTAEERAAYAALTLFAVHQQSQPQLMHVPGERLGAALARLQRAEGVSAERVEARVQRLMVAQALSPLVHQLDGAVRQLRGRRFGLDYAILADDLTRFQSARNRTSVRLAWGRSFYRIPHDRDESGGSDVSDTAE